MEHLPPPDKEQTAYNFDVAFLSGDGKDGGIVGARGPALLTLGLLTYAAPLEDIGAGSLLRQGLGSSLQTIRQMPPRSYFAQQASRGVFWLGKVHGVMA